MITQWLCPNRHAIGAVPWDSKTISEKEIIAEGWKLIKEAGLEYRCGICGSEDILPESGVTSFPTMETCLEAMRTTQIQLILSRLRLEGIRRNRN